ncbi:hypothetical protein D3C85_1121080 [compost metagenome]
MGDFAHDGARDELVLVRRRHEQGLDVRQQMAVHAGHLEFVFKVGHRAQAADDDAAALVADEVFQQAAEALHFHVGVVAQHFARDFHAFVDAEKGLFVAAKGDSHHDFVEKRGRTANQVFVAPGQRVESAGINSDDHASSVPLLVVYTILRSPDY